MKISLFTVVNTQLSFNQTYHSLLQDKLNQSSKFSWEVTQFAVGGWGTAQQLLALEKYGSLLNPDIVIVQFFANDICDNTINATDYAGNQQIINLYMELT